MRDTYNPFYVPPATPRTGTPKIRFSLTEARHLAVAVVVLAVAFSFFLARSGGTGIVLPSPLLLAASVLAVVPGFVFHELAHKIVAQRYGHWAEFRSQASGLLMSLLFALFSPILFVAPGAVLIFGRVTHRENGVISIAGPMVNLVLALATLPFTFATDPEAPLPLIMGTVSRINAILAVFNLLPFGPLDGKKVLAWNKVAWVVAFLLSLALFFVVQFRLLTA